MDTCSSALFTFAKTGTKKMTLLAFEWVFWCSLGIAINFYRLRNTQSTCNGFCGEYECKENKTGCKRKAKGK